MASVEEVLGEVVLVRVVGHALPVKMARTEFLRRFIPAEHLEDGAWISPRRDVAIRFNGLQKVQLRDPYHVPGDLWLLEKGEPKHVLKDNYHIALSLLLEEYSRDHELDRAIAQARVAEEARMSRLRKAKEELRAQHEINLLKSAVALGNPDERPDPTAQVLPERLPDGEEEVEVLLGKMGIHGSGWYVSSGNLKEFAQVVRPEDVQADAVKFRLWQASADGGWDVKSKEAAPLEFATGFIWCKDLAGLYVTQDQAPSILIRHQKGDPPQLTAWNFEKRTGKPLAEIGDRLPRFFWNRYQKESIESLPKNVRDQLGTLTQNTYSASSGGIHD